jgi:uncharacterized protein
LHIDPYIVLGSAVVGLLVGMTGAGGGALMTPMLILLFGVKAPAAISSDLVAAVVMRPVGAVVHMRKGTVNYRLVGWLALGSVPAALLGAYLLHVLGKGSSTHVEQALGAALLAGAAAMVIRYVLDIRGGQDRKAALRDLVVRPLPTIAVGVIGGVIVGMTSVGSGSLMIVLLLFLYPMISANRLVGTDLTQAVPLTLAAALGALVFGHVEFGVTVSIIIGSVPAVLIGSLFSSHAPDKFIRPVIGFVIYASGLKYVGMGAKTLGWTLAATLVAAAVVWTAFRLIRGRRAPAPALVAAGAGLDGASQAAASAAAAGPGEVSLNGASPDAASLNGASLNGAGPDAAVGIPGPAPSPEGNGAGAPHTEVGGASAVHADASGDGTRAVNADANGNGASASAVRRDADSASTASRQD